MTNNLPTAFLAVFDNSLSRDQRVDILFKVREQDWWQETDFLHSNRLNHVRIIIRDAGMLEQAMAYVNSLEGVTAERISYLDTCAG